MKKIITSRVVGFEETICNSVGKRKRVIRENETVTTTLNLKPRYVSPKAPNCSFTQT